MVTNLSSKESINEIKEDSNAKVTLKNPSKKKEKNVKNRFILKIVNMFYQKKTYKKYQLLE